MPKLLNKINKEKIKEVAKKFDTDLVLLFGSQATGKIHEQSDVDVAFLSRKDLSLEEESKFLSELTQIFKRGDLEIVNLKNASPTLMRAVARDGIVLYEKNNSIFWRWKLYANKIWMETAWMRRMRDDKLLKWAANQREKYAKR